MTTGRMFGSEALKVDDKVFAMVVEVSAMSGRGSVIQTILCKR